MKKLIVIAALAASSALAAPYFAPPPTSFNAKSADTTALMKAFWGCHQLSDDTERKGSERFPYEMLEVCSNISREVQGRFFKDDFGLMHQWTQVNNRARPLAVK